MKNDPVWKVANYKDHDSRNYKASLPHMNVKYSIDHYTAAAMPVQIGAGFSTLLITALCLGHSARDSIAACIALLLSNYSPVNIFICNFSICVTFHKFVLNVVNLWSLKKNEV